MTFPLLAAGPKEKMGLMVQDSSLERQDKKQLKKIRNRKSTILPLVIKKAQHTFDVVEPVDAGLTIRTGSTVNVTTQFINLTY